MEHIYIIVFKKQRDKRSTNNEEKIGIVILATMMATLVACGNESKIGSNETSTVAIDNETENNTQENTTEEKHESNNDELSNEYLLSLPETTVEDFNYHEMMMEI